MSKITFTRGMGVATIIVIIAIIVIVGYAVIRSAQQPSVGTNEDMQQESEMGIADTIRTEAKATLAEMQADIATNANFDLDGALVALADLAVRVESAALQVEGEEQAGLEELKDQVDAIRSDLEADITVASDSITATIAEIDADIEASMEALMIEENEEAMEEGHNNVDMSGEEGDAEVETTL